MAEALASGVLRGLENRSFDKAVLVVLIDSSIVDAGRLSDLALAYRD